ncbi:MAG: DNA methylase [Bacteroidetes bacterium CG_4_10_14_3_um_filter_31_20]|nr:DUF559 domain-containing protein [Bacteroidota bacterium]PIX35262.1 MAG: DNA methylase [Bacteroidetes bacterium CG_4_8_14_3_um_filter_31_14]PIY04660.1 MAG: DNA methylase [Bacteroidetes bacterium CG_4_10_14_3_um_filter_31_20]
MIYSNNNYNKSLKKFARENRNNGTKAEIRLWCELLRNKKMLGYGFLRQRPIGNYIADFFCKELKLVIEVDGFTHQFEKVIKKDKKKDEYFLEIGISILRFDDEDVMNEIENVSRVIEEWVKCYCAMQSHPLTP